MGVQMSSFSSRKKLAIGILGALLSGIWMPALGADSNVITEDLTLDADYSATSSTQNTKLNSDGGSSTLFNRKISEEGAGTYSDITVDLNHHNLNLTSDTAYSAKPIDFWGGSLTIKNGGNVNISANSTGEDDAYGMYFTGTKVSVDGNVNITNVSSDNAAAYGIRVRGNNNSLKINGDLTIKGLRSWQSGKEQPQQETDDYGIYLQSNSNSTNTLYVTGKTTITDIDGMALVNQGNKSGILSIAGGELSVRNPGSENDRLAVYANGTTRVNVADKDNGITPGIIKIKGDVLIARNGTLNLNIPNADSFWNGNVRHGTNKKKDNTFSLTLQNGGTWNVEQDSEWTVGKNYIGVGTVNTLTGGDSEENRGYIHQSVDESLYFVDYSGHTRIFYEHDKDTPTTMKGGNLFIDKAEDGSVLTLTTDQTGITMTDKTQVAAVLKALANKLYYAGTVNSDGKAPALAGSKVEIADGLTNSGASLKSTDLLFNTSLSETTNPNNIVNNTQYYQGTADYKEIDVPSDQAETEFSQQITGDEAKDEIYINTGVLKKGTTPETYKFTEDTTISLTADGANSDPEKNNGVVRLEGPKVLMDADGKTVTMNLTNTTSSGQTPVGILVDNNSDLEFKGKAIVNVSGDSRAVGVRIPGFTFNSSWQTIQPTPGNATFDNDLKVTSKLTGQGDSQHYEDGDDITGIYVGARGSSVTVKGKADITADASKASNPYALGVATTDIATQEGTAPRITLSGDTNINVSGHNRTYALSARGGTINVNTDGTAAGTKKVTIKGDIYAAGQDSETIQQDYTTGKTYNNASDGLINLALTTSDSSLTGVVDNMAGDHGTVNLWLSNGAVWQNEKQGSLQAGTKKENQYSFLNQLHGGNSDAAAGVINMGSLGISVDNYSGNTTVIYTHDSSNPLTIYGGDFKITNADSGSSITLVTDSKGLTTGFNANDKAADRNKVSEVLNKLANKLWYINYPNAKGNLTGKVKIAAGLTSRSASTELAKGDISFSTSDSGTIKAGQGFYSYTPAVDKKTGPIESSEDINETRKAEADGSVTVKTTTNTVTEGSSYVSSLYAGSTSYDKQHPMAVDMNGHDLNLDAASDNNIAAAVYVTDNASIQVKGSEGKKLSISASNSATRAADGILVKGDYGNLAVSGPTEIKNIITEGDAAAGISINGSNSTVSVDGDTTIDTVYGKRARGAGMNASGIVVTGDESNVNITGKANISGVQGSAIKTQGKDSSVSVGGGTITAASDANKSHNYYAARVEKGTININMTGDQHDQPGSNTTNITGDMYVTGQHGKKVAEYSGGELIDWNDSGKLNVALTNKDSAWNGMAAYDQYTSDYGTGGNTIYDVGEFNLYLQNGAKWTNEQQSHLTTTTIGDKKPQYTGSELAYLHGGSADNAGLIYQKDSRPITVNNYSGSTIVFYEHEESDPLTMIGGDFKITNADSGSSITLVTDSKGLTTGFNANDKAADRNKVSEVLNKLANKLWYINYPNAKGNLTGKVKIAAGLTSRSASTELAKGDISFSTSDSGTIKAGQGYYDYKLIYPSTQVTDPMNKTIDGSTASENAYKNAGIYKESEDQYDFSKNPATVNGDTGSAVNGKDKDLSLKGETINLNGGTDGTGVIADGKTVTIDSNANISGATGINATNSGQVSISGTSNISGTTGISAAGGGKVTINGASNITATGDAVNASGTGTTVALSNGGTISGTVKADDHASITANGAALQSGATASNVGSIALTNGTAVYAAADGAGSTLTTNGTSVSGTISAVNGANTTVTNGTAANATASGAGSTLTTTGTNISGIISATDGGTATMNNGTAAGLSADTDSTVAANLSEANARLNGDVANEGTAAVNLSNGSQWTGNSTGNGTTTATIASGSTWTGASTNGNTSVDLAGTWKQTGDSTIASLMGSNGTLDKSGANSGETNIAHYSGSMTAAYDHDEANPTNITGGGITIGQADADSSINLITSSKGLNMGRTADARNQVSETLNQLAHKLTYTANDGNLTGRIGISSGLTSSSASLRAENLTFDTNGVGSYVYTPVIDTLDIEYGSEETQMMRGTKSALLGSALLWRNNNNDLMRRMGDIRLGRQDTGIWAKYQGQKVSFDGQNADLDATYNGVQVGIDKNVNGWLVGAAFDYGKGKVDYKGGRGDDKMGTGAIYGSRQFSDGSYFDAIAKVGRVGNDFHVTNEIGNRLTGNYHSWGESLSVEYGKRFRFDSGFFLTPNVEFTMGHLASKTFNGHSDLGTMRIKQHDFNSAIGRIGVGFGWERPNSTLFAKFDVAHEFGGNFRTDYYAEDGGAKSTHVDLSDTWLDMELGGSVNVGKDTYLYGTYTRSFGADAQTKWRADVGVRYTF